MVKTYRLITLFGNQSQYMIPLMRQQRAYLHKDPRSMEKGEKVAGFINAVFAS